jgi:hypothetical protein
LIAPWTSNAPVEGEAGKLSPDLCNEKVQDLRARLGELEAQRQDLKARRERLELPAIDRQVLSSLVDEFERVMAAGTNAQRKDLLHRVVKKVLIRDRHTVEVWYALPNRGEIESCNSWLLGLMSQSPVICDLATLKASRGLWYVLRLRLAS